MPASNRVCSCKPLARDEAAVTEVTSYLLIFGILTVMLSVSMLGFTAAKEGAEERGAKVRAESVAQRVAGVVVDASVFAEAQGSQLVDYTDELDLPERLEGRDYTIQLAGDQVTVYVSGFDITVTEPLFRSGAPPGIVICEVDPLPPDSFQVVVTPTNPDNGGSVQCTTVANALYVTVQTT